MNSREIPLIASDPELFATFYREQVGAVEGFVARRVRDPELAADLTADVFLAAIDAAARYRPRRGEPGAWLFGIARNVVHAEYRRAGRERATISRVIGRRLLDEEDTVRLQERIDAEARSRELFEALGRLGEAERAVFELHALDGLAPAEIAVALGIRPVTARVRLHRARAALRDRLAQPEQLSTRQMEVSS